MAQRWGYEYIFIRSYGYRIAPDIAHKANSKQQEYEVRGCEGYSMDMTEGMDMAQIGIDCFQ